MDATTLGWFAGVIDLKGTIIRKNNQTRATPQLVLLIDTRHKAVADRMATMTGTGIGTRDVSVPLRFERKQCREHCPEVHVHVSEMNMPQTYRWQATGVAAAIILHNLLPYMTTASARDFGGTITEIIRVAAVRGQGSGATREAIVRLAGLGWDIPAALLRRMGADMIRAVNAAAKAA